MQRTVIFDNLEMITPEIDERSYRVIRLTNNLEVLVISDVNSTTCAASMAVGAGTFMDDHDSLGLAHFFEHMLFLGSKTFPNPSQLENHLSENFGRTNAFTEEEKTIFYFDVSGKGFELALTMFSRMFAEPRLDITLMNKEIEAVNSENEKNFNNDNWRQQQLIRSFSNPNHPFHKFGTGSRKTLGSINPDVLHKKIVSYYKKYYVPENMKLVVQANLSIERLQELVMKLFSDIRIESIQKEPEMKYGALLTSEPPYLKKDMGKVVWFQKISNLKNLDIIFVVDEVVSKYKTKAFDYVSYYLKFAGDNSFISKLKDKKWIIKMDVGIINSFTHFAQFAVTFSLTNEGYENVDRILEMFISYFNMFKSNKININTYNEIKLINENNFK